MEGDIEIRVVDCRLSNWRAEFAKLWDAELGALFSTPRLSEPIPMAQLLFCQNFEHRVDLASSQSQFAACHKLSDQGEIHDARPERRLRLLESYGYKECFDIRNAAPIYTVLRRGCHWIMSSPRSHLTLQTAIGAENEARQFHQPVSGRSSC